MVSLNTVARRPKETERIVPARAFPGDNPEYTDPETGERLSYNTETERVTNQTHWETYCRKGVSGLEIRHADAAKRFWGYWYRGGLERSQTGSLAPLTGVSADPFWAMASTEKQAHARQRFRDCLRAVGKSSSSVLIWSVIDDKPAEEIGRKLFKHVGKARAVTAGLAALKGALDDLADHLGID